MIVLRVKYHKEVEAAAHNLWPFSRTQAQPIAVVGGRNA